jgi:hypothetical protein
MAADLAQHHHRPGDGMTLIDVQDTRPGGPNRQERAHRVGAPESLTNAIKETGMLQVHTCVSVHCDQCGDNLGGPGFQTHYPTEDAVLDVAAAQGWRVGPGGRLWCSACGPVLTCDTRGHEFTPWRHVLINECQELFTRLGHAATTADGHLVSREYRYCRQCCLHESRRNWVLINGLRGQGKGGSVATALLPAGAEVSGEVA